jgi:DNA-binding response OmpR family regulator
MYNPSNMLPPRLTTEDILSGIHIMIVEDDRITRRLLHDLLKILGFTNVHIEPNGRAALDYISYNPVDIIICDWKMAPMDGIELTRAVRTELSGGKRFTPIIMLTGKADERDVIEARDSGVTEYLIKPFSADTLFSRIKIVADNPRGFVMSTGYTGPDRRRRRETPPDGMKKRETD